MKVKPGFLSVLHLDKRKLLLTGRGLLLVKTYFNLLDMRGTEYLDDLQFLAFMKECTDLSERKIYEVFDMFDGDDSGSIEFDEFYLLVCFIISIKDQEEKQFLWQHSRTCFELLDVDGDGFVKLSDFQKFGNLFNVTTRTARKIFSDFDVDSTQELDFEEFRTFSLACIDKQRQIDRSSRIVPDSGTSCIIQ